MRRALVLLAAVSACLLVAAPAAAPAAPASSPATEVEGTVHMTLHTGGFKADLFSENNDGEVSAILLVTRGHQIAYYLAPATVTEESIEADFGHFGQLDFHFSPRRPAVAECAGLVTFRGSFTFTGEHGYIHIDTDHAEGSFGEGVLPPSCGSARSARRAVPYKPTYSGDGATVIARARSAGAPLRVRGVSVADLGRTRHDRVFLFGYTAERREGVTSLRGAQMTLGRDAFHWNLKAGTATVRPPGAFAGWAAFRRRPHGRPAWRGPLELRVLGDDTVRLTGPAFRAQLHKGVQADE